MISLPTSFIRGHELIMHSYYGRFLMHVATQNLLNGMYGLTGDMIDIALQEFGGHLGGDDEIIFDDDSMSTLFVLRWS